MVTKHCKSELGHFRVDRPQLRLRPLAAGVCACLAFGGTAYGQSDGVEEVLVTGSRIVRRDLDAPSPIITVDSELFEQNSSVAVEAVLNQFPQFNPGATQFTTGEIQPTATTSPGASTLNMRGLGANRSLVLLDGRRAQPVNAAMTVDVNTIPAAAISDVEVISGGAAATYGPDAMAGVVNFKLRRDFEGIDINYQTGTTEAGDGEETRFDVLMGGNFAENRGNAMFSVGYANREPAWQMNRDFFIDGFNDPGTPANYPRIDYPYYTPAATNLPNQAVVNQVLGATANQSRTVDFYTNPLDGTVFRQQNALGYTGPTTFPYKIRTHNGSLEEGSPRSYASTPLTRYSLFGRSTYELTDKMSAFAQGTFVMTNVDTVLFPTPLTGVAVPHGNNVYAPSVDAQGNTLAAYRPGGAHGLELRADGRLHGFAGLARHARVSGVARFAAARSRRHGSAPGRRARFGHEPGLDDEPHRVLVSEPCVVERDDVERVHRGPRGCGRQHRLDVGGLHIVRQHDLADPHEELRLDRALREPRTAAELRHGRRVHGPGCQ